MSKKTQHVAQYKKDQVKELHALLEKYPIVAAIDMENLPAQQLQQMRAQLRDKIDLLMLKRRIMKVAFEQVKDKHAGIEQLVEHLRGMPALLFTKENPFSLFKMLKKSKSKAPAKAGQTAPFDIMIPKGPTGFAPGPIIGELATAGIAAGVEDGKVVVKADSLAVKEGEVIDGKTAELLTRLQVQPMEVGLNITAVLEDGKIYTSSILDIDEEQFAKDMSTAAVWAFNLAFETAYPVKDNISLLLGKAFREAKAVGISASILDDGIIGDLLSKAAQGASSLQATAGIEVGPAKESPKEAEEKKEEAAEEKKEESVPEVPKEKPEEAKEEEKKAEVVEEKKEEPKETEEKKEEVKEAPVEEKKEEVPEAPKEEPVVETPVEEKKEEPAPEPVEEKKEEAVETSQEEPTPEVPAEDPVAEAPVEEKKEEVTEAPVEEKAEEPQQKEEEKGTDDKIAEMVSKTKAFNEGDVPTVDELLSGDDTPVKEKAPSPAEVKKPTQAEAEVLQEEGKEIVEEKKEEAVEDKKEESKEEDTDKKKEDQKKVEDLTQELIKKGTLRD